MKKILVLLAGLAFLLTGCSMPSTAVDEVAVHRGGGLFESQSPKGCVPSGTKEVNSPGDSYFYYPANQSTYDFTGGKNSDSAPFTVVTKDNQTFEIPGSVKFSLNTKCEVLEKFHDNIGNRYAAYNTDSGQPRNDGWRKMLSLYIAPAVDGTLDRIAKQYNWRELRNDPSIKDKMNSEVNETVARLIQQPVAPKELSIAAAAEESARAQASATQVKAEADAAAAEAAAKSQVKQKEAELKVAQIEADIKAAEIAAYGSIREYNNRMAIEKGLNPYQPTIVVGGGVAGK
jgi:hypothetical protein